MNRAEELLSKHGRCELGVDGNAAFALLGPDLQEGEAEFVTIPDDWDKRWELKSIAERACAKTALANLCKRLGVEHIPYYFGPSHPFGA